MRAMDRFFPTGWRQTLATVVSVACCACSGRDCGPTVVSNFEKPIVALRSIAVVGNDVFWAPFYTSVDTCEGALFMAPRGGGAAIQVDAGCATSIAFDADHVFWIDTRHAPIESQGSLWSRSRAEGTNTKLAEAPNFLGVTAGPLGVYAVVLTALGPGPTSVLAYTSSGGSPRTLLTSSGGGLQGPIAADGANVYLVSTTHSTNDVLQIPVAGGPAVVLASLPGFVSEIAIDANRLYWIGDDPPSDTSTLMSVPLSGGIPTPLVQDGLQTSFAVDSSHLYWNDPTSQSIKKMPLGGGASLTLVTHPGIAGAIALDSSSLYYADQGALYRVCK